MNKIRMTTKINGNVFIFGIPLLLILSMVLLTKSKVFVDNSATLSIAIIIDLLFTIPFVYFLLIKNKSIPKTTVAPLFIIGIVTAGFIIPQEHQTLLEWSKNWIFPLVEIAVATFIFYKVRRTIKRFKENAIVSPDIFSAIKETCLEILPKRVAGLLSMELAVIYYGLISWRKKELYKNEFTYHKNSGTIGLFVALIVIITIETYVLHILLLKWSTIAAWIATVLSIYTTLQIFGFLKSITKRPIAITEDLIHLRYGILSETAIKICDIESIEISTKDIEINHETKKLSPLGELENHNLIIRLKKEHFLSGIYGLQKPFKNIAFYVDDKEKFKNLVENSVKERPIKP